MPHIQNSDYKRPKYFLNGHWETIIPSIRNIAPDVSFTRERLELDDGDFLDLDWLEGDQSRLMIITHGLEGNSQRHYVRRPASYFHHKGWSILAWNCRSCSGEMNRLPRFYHHGATEDLEAVVTHAIHRGFSEIVLMGFSMGGSMSLKYLGESQTRPQAVIGAITFSVPCNLKDSAVALEKKSNRFYERRFLKKLTKKIEAKANTHAEIDGKQLKQVVDFNDFHERYTVPLHGFASLDDFYSACTCDQYLPQIDRPVYILNAWNDPLLMDGCYPLEIAKKSKYVFLQTSNTGGHVGFSMVRSNLSWMEVKAEQFLQEHLLT